MKYLLIKYYSTATPETQQWKKYDNIKKSKGLYFQLEN